MKKSFIVLLLAITSLSFYSCKKSSTPAKNSTSTQWTLKGVTYKASFTPYTNPILQATDASNNSIAIYFNAKPTTSGTYTVTATSPGDPNKCSMIITNATDSYYTTGKTGDQATVTVSGGEVTVVFSGVTVQGFDTNEITTASGTIVEND